MDHSIAATPTAGITVACPCCGGLSMALFEDTLDVEGNITTVEICLVCSALLNRSSLQRLAAQPETLREVQTGHLSTVYPLERDAHAALQQEVGAHRTTLDFFLGQAAPERRPAELVCAEIGIGRGTFIRTAAELFHKCYAIDLSYEVFEGTRDLLAVPDNIFLLESIDHLPEPVDVVIAWHSLEHLPRLYEMVEKIRSALNPGGHLFIQVPLYRPDHLVDSHYTFLNRRAIAVLAELERFDVVGLWTDHPRACLTGLLRKPDTSAEI
jgi:2-polyprenyl-3-methyl-5-hydroxy-6-metoxy-1,4-benzoquinol methylase